MLKKLKPAIDALHRWRAAVLAWIARMLAALQAPSLAQATAHVVVSHLNSGEKAMARKAPQKTLALTTSRVMGPGGVPLRRGAIVKASGDYADELVETKRARPATDAEIARMTLIPELIKP